MAVTRRTYKSRRTYKTRPKSYATRYYGRGAYRTKPAYRPYRRVYRGRGGYFGDAWNWIKSKIPKGALELGGSLAGAAVGGPIGKFLGGGAGSLASKALGMGSYKIKSNSLMPGSTQQVPDMHNASHEVRVRHKEFLCDVKSSTGFVTQCIYDINPGLLASYPWLAVMAQLFEEYEIKGQLYYFRATAGDAISSTNNSLGTVIMAVDYNPLNPAFNNKQSMLNTMWSTSGKPSCDNMMFLECSRKQNPINSFYVRTGAVPTGADERLYDIGNFQLSTQGMQQAGVDIGELWVSYDIVFRKPIITPLAGGGLSNVMSARYHATSGATTSAYFGTTLIQSFDNFAATTNGLTFTGTKITFPVGIMGTFAIIIHWQGTGTAGAPPTSTAGGSAVATVISINSNQYDYAPGNIGGTLPTTTDVMTATYIAITDPTVAGTVTLSGGTLPSATCAVSIVVAQLNGALAAASLA